VARPGGVVAIWCYGLPTISPEVDPVVREFHDVTVGPEWAPRRTLVTTLYRTVAFPFDEVAAPALAIERSLDLPGLVAYIGTWSAVGRHRARTGGDPIPGLADRLRPAWGGASARRVTWPIGMRVGLVE
jgi:hypothetical protein